MIEVFAETIAASVHPALLGLRASLAMLDVQDCLAILACEVESVHAVLEVSPENPASQVSKDYQVSSAALLAMSNSTNNNPSSQFSEQGTMASPVSRDVKVRRARKVV